MGIPIVPRNVSRRDEEEADADEEGLELHKCLLAFCSRSIMKSERQLFLEPTRGIVHTLFFARASSFGDYIRLCLKTAVDQKLKANFQSLAL